MRDFYVMAVGAGGGEVTGPITPAELRERRVAPDELVRFGEDAPWSHLATVIGTSAEARDALEDGVDPDQPSAEPWQTRSLVEYTWPAMLLGADGLWLVTAASANDSAAGWVTAATLVAIMVAAAVGLLRRQPWAWTLAAALFAATATWMLAPLVASPSASLGLWFGINLFSAGLMGVRRPRGAALDWPASERRLLLLYSSAPAREARPLRARTDRAGPVAAFSGAAAFFVVAVAGVALYHYFRYPGVDLPVSLVPRGGDVWGRLAALGVYASMVAIAVVASLRGRAIAASLGLVAGHGLRRAAWTGLRVFLLLFVVLLASRWIMRTVEVVEQRLAGPAVSTVDDTATAQIRTAVESALDRTRRPGGLSLRHAWLLIVALLVGPICEEIFFRGLIFGALRRRWPFWAAALASALVFAASHGWGAGWGLAGPVLWLQIAAGGVAAAYAYELTGTLAAPIVMHALWNAAQTATQLALD
jgi:membrane protease YdiL (CAAX protease family)